METDTKSVSVERLQCHLETRLREIEFPFDTVTAVVAGTGWAFHVEVTSIQFEGQTRDERHNVVDPLISELGDDLDQRVTLLRTLTPKEAKQLADGYALVENA